MKLLIVMLLISVNVFAADKKVDRHPSEWSTGKKGELVTSYMKKTKAAFLKEANRPNSVVQNDIKKTIADHSASWGECGGVTFPEKITESSIIMTPFSYDGFAGRHCIEEPKENCDHQDDEGFLVLLPYTSSCIRNSAGSSLVYKMTYHANFSGGKDEIKGPVAVKIED